MEFIETPLFEKSKEGIFDEDESSKISARAFGASRRGGLDSERQGFEKNSVVGKRSRETRRGACHILLDKRGKHDFSAFGI